MSDYTPGSKIVDLTQAESVVRKMQVAGETVVLCHGCFDIVHPGHVRHLKEARRYGDKLVVSISGDATINKGPGRPLIPQELRAENLAALDCVDLVTVDSQPTAVSLLVRLRPDVYIKGREYEHNGDLRCRAEREVVESYGGRMVFTSGDVVFSSSALIEAMEDSEAPFQSELRRLSRHHDLDAAGVERALERARGRRVLVVGEVILDTYVHCARPQLASESPVISLRPLESRSFDGGAAIVARHLAAMGARPTLLTVLPKSSSTTSKHASAKTMCRRLEDEGIDVQFEQIDRPLLEKQRFLVGSQKVMKLDLGEPLTLDVTQQQRLLDRARQISGDCHAAVICDYGQGLFSDVMLSEMCQSIRPLVDLMIGDVSGERSNLKSFRHMDLLCPSEMEMRDALHEYQDGLTTVTWSLLQETQSRSAMVTLGEEGLIAFDHRDDAYDAHRDTPHWRSRLQAMHLPSFTPHAVDQLGCGDSLLAAATMTLSGGGSTLAAAVVGTVAASIQARRLGNAVIGVTDLRQGLRRLWDAQLAVTAGPASHVVLDSSDHLRTAHA